MAQASTVAVHIEVLKDAGTSETVKIDESVSGSLGIWRITKDPQEQESRILDD